jgi:hypothetical protein
MGVCSGVCRPAWHCWTLHQMLMYKGGSDRSVGVNTTVCLILLVFLWLCEVHSHCVIYSWGMFLRCQYLWNALTPLVG